jgi:hypothetical protein
MKSLIKNVVAAVLISIGFGVVCLFLLPPMASIYLWPSMYIGSAVVRIIPSQVIYAVVPDGGGPAFVLIAAVCSVLFWTCTFAGIRAVLKKLAKSRGEMTTMRDRILRLCNDALSANTQGSRCLLINGIKFHELNFEELCAAIVGLSRIALRPSVSCVTEDHISLWKWCRELLLNHKSNYFSQNQSEIRELTEAIFAAALANESHVPVEVVGMYNKTYLNKNHIVQSYMSFPFLEGILKKVCKSYVEFDGTIKQPFPKKNGGQYHVGRKCSSLYDLLVLHYSFIADTDMVTNIDMIKANFTEIKPTETLFEVIYQWRNSSLHGADLFYGIGAFVINYAILVSLTDIKSDYNAQRQALLV